MRKSTIIALLIGIIVSGFVLAAGASEEESGSDGTLRFVAIAKSLDNPAFQVAEQGAIDRVAELDGVELEWTAPTGADPAQMVQMIESYVQRGVDGLLVDSLGPSVCGAVDAAVAAGVPVVTWDSDCPDTNRAAYVGSDNYEGGYKSGELYAEAIGDNAGLQRIAILTGQPGAFNLQERDRDSWKRLKTSGLSSKL
jgi:ribose transport system substrate-binding protein